MGRDPPLFKGRPWSPGQMDTAETFTEAGVSAVPSNAAVQNEGLALYDSGYAAESVVGDMTSTSGTSNHRGIEFTLHEDVNNLEVYISEATSGWNDVQVYDGSGNLQDQYFPSSAGWFSIGNLTAGTHIIGLGNGDDTIYTGAYRGSVSSPDDGPLTIEGYGDGSGGSSSQIWNFERIRGDAAAAATSGSVTITWPAPDDLAGWDIIPFEAAEDGATVEIYAIDPSDGSTLAGPLDDPGDISALARSTNVGVGVELTRSDTSQNPRLEAVYRRYKV